MLSSYCSKMFPLAAILFLAVLAAGPAFAGATSQDALSAVAVAPSLTANCGPTLDLPSQVVKSEICPVATPESVVPEFMAKPQRYCVCGCGATCTTDADCDGGACVLFITCC